ncbi:MAG TPA: UDP-N-acetylmuramoyl-L-alanine--D-glutamate ligase [Spirochaetota bacterium]|nr:UDP-N-acetylmuramoyl-L-alanine--D-glutamate ligase [Spirochaetota bacterium]HOS34045.1 UDP-N-acetylmuramoyl-L-alanine--D-glutamate ligase [Spirochaetota bacterium]HOS55029.1 UDP-N-acetylmuramoyl-L-alanine--D-glutamate ligase [Spirochaetota bacterium]HPK62538.1 UDP-N-acetylmuramoyl-L-alanine--D-glutamate ligase [Spirochaetota bacterium]HQF77554.1 UDP-N-acetylmuramoyl-L-alanine--D-glutamate ligase [Spirochaetota bacterium]
MNAKLDKYIEKIRDKKILIQGLGLNGGGVGTALFFLKTGIPVFITDLKSEIELEDSLKKLSGYKNVRYTLGCHKEEDFLNADIVVKGPGVPPTNKFIRLAEDNGAVITSDMEIFFNIAPCDIFGITGSKGKSSTVSCVYSIFKSKSANSFLGGNITISPLSFYNELNKDSLVILELSSWQLRDLQGKDFKLKGAAITNLMRDHQNYYKNMTDYLNDKKIITNNQTSDNFLILPYGDVFLNTENIETQADVYYYSKDREDASFFYDKNTAYKKNRNSREILFDAAKISVPGEHTKSNILLAAGFCALAGIERKFIERGIENFRGAPFRMEFVGEIDGVKYINDATATIPDASVAAIRSFKEPIVWIAGGSDKNLDFSVIEEISDIPKAILLLPGDGTQKMKKFIKNPNISEFSDLETLFSALKNIVKSGDVVLFSPGCTSFGLFQNEFHRGRVFNDLVKKMIDKTN